MRLNMPKKERPKAERRDGQKGTEHHIAYERKVFRSIGAFEQKFFPEKSGERHVSIKGETVAHEKSTSMAHRAESESSHTRQELMKAMHTRIS